MHYDPVQFIRSFLEAEYQVTTANLTVLCACKPQHTQRIYWITNPKPERYRSALNLPGPKIERFSDLVDVTRSIHSMGTRPFRTQLC